ncbi:cbb3-type cytochrome c oxidase subunit I [Fodinibius sp. AD559]|uniref:cbb3-type cytochrome c oxidase subunit I n=1 Tax=Fodinibius sp. AD559 TaxID=3424179 RepID=UPI0040469618
MLLILKKAVLLPVEIWTAAQSLTARDFSKRWLKLALLTLLLSGLFSVVIVLARTPGLSAVITDPLFFKKSLVLHVDLALVIWFYSFLAVLFMSLTNAVSRLRNAIAMKIALFGVLVMISSIFFESAKPILANYIPVLDHPLFIIGLLLFGIGLIVTFSSGISNPDSLSVRSKLTFYSDSARDSIRLAGFLVLVAIITLVISWFITPVLTDRTSFYERVMWGGGHILQFANVLGMLTVWLILLHKLTGSDVISKNLNRGLLLVLVIPAAASPLLLFNGTTSSLYYSGFTQLMRWFIFPVVLVYIGIAIHSVWKTRNEEEIDGPLFQNLYFNGLFVSVLLTLTGFGVGAMIRTSSTLIPAHYHASLGAVTVAYMVMVIILMKEYGYSLDGLKSKRLVSWQPLLFGLGQTIFVIGFAYAGLQGMGRKLFGTDQSIHSIEAMIGLGLMSIGGLLAITGGFLFIYIIAKSYTNGRNK